MPGEFKKLVYDSKFTKRAEGMSFVNAKLALGPPAKVPRRQQQAGGPKAVHIPKSVG